MKHFYFDTFDRWRPRDLRFCMPAILDLGSFVFKISFNDFFFLQKTSVVGNKYFDGFW